MDTEYFKNKLSEIKEVNDKIFGSLLKNTELYNNIIFIYTPPKVGSTSLVSSIRISASHKFTIIHIHDEIMLNFFTKIKSYFDLKHYYFIFIFNISYILDYLSCKPIRFLPCKISYLHKGNQRMRFGHLEF